MNAGEVTVKGVSSPYLAAGDAKAHEAAVFVHGNPGSREDFAPLVERVGRFARAVALDMPGFGAADRPARFAYTVEGYAEHLNGCLAALGITRAHLVLHDFGGPWGLAWAAAHPDAFASATLIDTGVLLGYRWHKMARLWRTPVIGELSMALMAIGGASGFARALATPAGGRPLPRAFTDRMHRDLDRGTRRAILKLYRATGDVAARGERLRDALAPLDRPCLVVWGARDPYLPVAQAELQRQSFPHARVEILADSGHWPMADDPARFEPLVAGFLEEVCGAAALRPASRRT